LSLAGGEPDRDFTGLRERDRDGDLDPLAPLLFGEPDRLLDRERDLKKGNYG